MIRFILIAFIGSLLLASPLTQGADESPTAILRRQGEEKGRAKDYEAALTLFQKARDLAPDESANYTRIATTAIMLGRRQLGLDALDKACQLDPKLKEVQTVIALRQALEALPAPVAIAAAAPTRDANLRLTLLTIQSIFDDISSAREAHDATRADELARQAREKIAPVLIDPEMADVDLWVYAGRIALATGDDNLAAFAMEAIVRLDPAALDNADRAKIVALLNRRPIAEKVKSIPTERADLLANRKKAHDGDKAASLDLADAYAKGTGIPRNISAARKLGWKGMAIDVTNSLRMDFVRIEPGTFTMGSPESEKERSKDETQHRVKLTHPFMMATTAVTQAQWRAVMQTDPSQFKGDTLPVEQVSWNDAIAFCKKLSETEGRHYRLPTEAEWEYACRAGTTTPFNTGETISTGQANYDGDYVYGDGVKGENRKTTTPVGTFKANAWGLYDMHGNVWQWCSDGYAEYSMQETVDPKGLEGAASRVLRGGSWSNYPRNCRSASRNGHASDYRYGNVGFRLCLDFE